MTDHRCRRGSRCAQWEADDARRLGARINAQDGFCDSCARHLERAITLLPRDYVALHDILASANGGTREYVADTPEMAIPIRVDIDALQTEMVHEAQCWAESTADILGIAWDTQDSRDARPGHTLQRACSLLAKSLSVLLALRDVQHSGWSYGCWTVLSRDGLDGAVVLLDLHHRARVLTGQTGLINRLPAPCPRCETLALERADGSESIDCSACGRRYTWDEYQRLCSILVDRRITAA